MKLLFLNIFNLLAKHVRGQPKQHITYIFILFILEGLLTASSSTSRVPVPVSIRLCLFFIVFRNDGSEQLTRPRRSETLPTEIT